VAPRTLLLSSLLCLVSACNYCPGGRQYDVIFRFELPDATELRDVEAVTCVERADGSGKKCAAGWVGYDRENTLEPEGKRSRFYDVDVWIDAPARAEDGALALHWLWEDDVDLKAGDRYTLSIVDGSGQALFEAEQVARYQRSTDACNEQTVLDEMLP
jgi:hypothetical protein